MSFDLDMIGCQSDKHVMFTIYFAQSTNGYSFSPSSINNKNLIFTDNPDLCHQTKSFTFDVPSQSSGGYPGVKFEWSYTSYVQEQTCCWSISNVTIQNTNQQTFNVSVCGYSKPTFLYNDKLWVCHYDEHVAGSQAKFNSSIFTYNGQTLSSNNEQGYCSEPSSDVISEFSDWLKDSNICTRSSYECADSLFSTHVHTFGRIYDWVSDHSVS